MKIQPPTDKPPREVHFDGFKEWFTTGGPDVGHHVGTLWTHNNNGERVEVEVHLHAGYAPLDTPYEQRVALCRRVMQSAYKELMEKAEEVLIPTRRK